MKPSNETLHWEWVFYPSFILFHVTWQSCKQRHETLHRDWPYGSFQSARRAMTLFDLRVSSAGAMIDDPLTLAYAANGQNDQTSRSRMPWVVRSSFIRPPFCNWKSDGTERRYAIEIQTHHRYCLSLFSFLRQTTDGLVEAVDWSGLFAAVCSASRSGLPVVAAQCARSSRPLLPIKSRFYLI